LGEQPSLASGKLRVATWNMDHWRRTPEERAMAWRRLQTVVRPTVALLQEAVPPQALRRRSVVYREIGRARSWGSAVVGLRRGVQLRELWSVRTRYSAQTFTLLNTFPGCLSIAVGGPPGLAPITFISLYGVIDVYSQTTLLRLVADLIPLFDSESGERVILGGDFNVGTDTMREPERSRYTAILGAFEALGLVNLYETVSDRPGPPEACPCASPVCRHLTTREGGGQFDYLFASASLAADCHRIVRFDDAETRSLSDHWPIVADFDFSSEGEAIGA
jgi:endonuclease/exonuclease/phosphatase family metal-dependent hydrolase